MEIVMEIMLDHSVMEFSYNGIEVIEENALKCNIPNWDYIIIVSYCNMNSK